MGVSGSVWSRIKGGARHRAQQRPPGSFVVRDPDLLAMAEIANQKKLGAERSLDIVFEKVRPILHREPDSAPPPVHIAELPADLKARIAEMPDAEERIRAIVEFKLSSKRQSSHHE